MIAKLNEWGPMTVLMILAAALMLGGGIANVIIDPDYTYSALLDDLKTFAIGLGALGIGRGLLTGLRDHGLATTLPATIPGESQVPHDQQLPPTTGDDELGQAAVDPVSEDAPLGPERTP